MKKINKVLVANRGEIALRIMRTLHKMGIESVAVYSEADANAPFVRFANEAYLLGAAPSSESYLRGDKIIDICLKTGADAIHPGYGFLSENAAFRRKVAQAGILFIGPSPEAMELMGSKIAAKAAVKKFDVPLVPGMDEPIIDVAKAEAIAEEVGFPVLIKASAGGGGKGMRIVEKKEDFRQQMQRAQSEALSAFGDDSVFIERWVQSPRHIEIQVLADNYGHTVYLFERECSVQRRHQKVIEEAPSTVLTPELRTRMGQAAVNVCKAAGYTNAGTVEFLLDAQQNFYFLEMNTRLQVEHPVTEMITGLDLVEQQIRIAEGSPLPFTQEELKIMGHAIEARVYAEDPANQFLPDIGKLLKYIPPCGEGIRVDGGFEEGMDIPIYYDPMIAKLIVHAPNRKQAIQKMLNALNQYVILGVETTVDFCKFVLEHPDFQSGNFDTHFVEKYFEPHLLNKVFAEEEAQAIALLAFHLQEQKDKMNIAPSVDPSVTTETSNWRALRSK
jgi:acetyl-CoA carboxylase biotin carboxylase subunit